MHTLQIHRYSIIDDRMDDIISNRKVHEIILLNLSIRYAEYAHIRGKPAHRCLLILHNHRDPPINTIISSN